MSNAETETKISKKQMILDAVTTLGNEASAADVQAHLLETHGSDATVSVNYISMIRNEGSTKKGKFSVANAVAELLRLKELVEELGGIKAVREAVETAGKFTEVVGSGNELESLEQLEQLG